MENDRTTKVTKVLIHKLHGGRKQDSKFWQSAFSHAPEDNHKQNQPNGVKFALYPLVLLALFIIGYGSYYAYKHFIVSPDLSFKVATIDSRIPLQSEETYKNKSIYYSGNKKNKPS